MVFSPLGDGLGNAGLLSDATVLFDGRERHILNVGHICNQVTNSGFAAGDHETKEAT